MFFIIFTLFTITEVFSIIISYFQLLLQFSRFVLIMLVCRAPRSGRSRPYHHAPIASSELQTTHKAKLKKLRESILFSIRDSIENAMEEGGPHSIIIPVGFFQEIVNEHQCLLEGDEG
jgi:hypothetical protein